MVSLMVFQNSAPKMADLINTPLQGVILGLHRH